MFINKLSLTNFRNIKKINLAFDTPLTILYGNNGQGKTNIVESIYLLANATSFRTSSFKEMILNDEETSLIEGEIVSTQRKSKQKKKINQELRTVKNKNKLLEFKIRDGYRNYLQRVINEYMKLN